MTARDDFDRLVSSWFEENAPIREPEHLLGQVLARTARTRRRPSWLVPERWLSVQLVTRWQTVPRVAPLAVALMLLLALLAAALLISGRPRLPAPFGPAANGLIAYMSGPQIVVAPIGGSDPRPLTPAAEVAGEPVFSPLGRQIAYKLYDSRGSTAWSALQTVNLETGVSLEVHPLGPTPSTPSWSPDEQFLVFSQPTNLLASDRIFIVDAEASAPARQIGPDSDAVGPVFSPDGRRIAFFLVEPESLTLSVMDADGSNVRELASFPVIGGAMQHGGTGYAWSPDGTTLLVNGGPSEDDLDLYTIEVDAAGADGKPVVRQITNTPLLEYGASWSTDGNRIVYLHGPNADFPEVVVSRPDGSNRAVISGSAEMTWLSPHWSPDSKLVVATTRSPGSQILLMDPDGLVPPRTIVPPEYETTNDVAPGGWTSSRSSAGRRSTETLCKGVPHVSPCHARRRAAHRPGCPRQSSPPVNPSIRRRSRPNRHPEPNAGPRETG